MIPKNKYSRPQLEKAYSKREIAREQLKTATNFFLLEIDDSSAITLAGAASNILHQMVINTGKEPFHEYARRICQALTGMTPPRKKYAHKINELFGINAHKHLGKEGSETVELDLRKCAQFSLTKAMDDYRKLYGSDEDFVHAFYQWAWVNLDGPSIMKNLKNTPKEFIATTEQKHKIFDLAANQLQMAVILFIHDQDKFSAITLAGAADVLLSKLVKNQGKENFTELLKKEETDKADRQLSLGDFGRKINNMASINAVKHFDDGESDQVSMDLDACALTAIMKALPNFSNLGGRNYKFVQEFLTWVQENLDPIIYNIHCDPGWKPSVD